jgi:hypothetical protein
MRLDGTISEVMAFRHESARTVFGKLRDRVYRSHKNGDTRLNEWPSVIEERNACIARGPQLSPRPATGKRAVGRPRKTTNESRARSSDNDEGEVAPEPAGVAHKRKRRRHDAPAETE